MVFLDYDCYVFIFTYNLKVILVVLCYSRMTIVKECKCFYTISLVHICYLN